MSSVSIFFLLNTSVRILRPLVCFTVLYSSTGKSQRPGYYLYLSLSTVHCCPVALLDICILSGLWVSCHRTRASCRSLNNASMWQALSHGFSLQEGVLLRKWTCLIDNIKTDLVNQIIVVFHIQEIGRGVGGKGRHFSPDLLSYMGRRSSLNIACSAGGLSGEYRFFYRWVSFSTQCPWSSVNVWMSRCD